MIDSKSQVARTGLEIGEPVGLTAGGTTVQVGRPMHKLALLVALLAASGCAKTPAKLEATRAEVYFREFSIAGFVRQTEQTLPRSASFSAVIDEPSKIDNLVRSLTKECQPDTGASADKMDLYLLVRVYSGTRLVNVLKASKFHAEYWPEGRSCALTEADRENIVREMRSLGATDGSADTLRSGL